MNTGMPLVHQARRTLRNRAEGNPFATDSYIAILLVEMAAAYGISLLRSPSQLGAA
jgi:hypothetical protein